jgi:hypothetical protein
MIVAVFGADQSLPRVDRGRTNGIKEVKLGGAISRNKRPCLRDACGSALLVFLYLKNLH